MRRPLIAVLLFAAGPVALAQPADLSPDGVFTFAPAAGPDEVAQASDVKGTANPAVRPNTATEVFLYARNPTGVEQTFTVDLAGDPGTPLAGRGKVVAPANKWVRVRLLKPAVAPAPVPGAAPVPPPAVPPPPGVEVKRADGGVFAFTVRLLDEDGKPVRDAAGRAYGTRSGVRFRAPADTVTVAKQAVTVAKDNTVSLAVTVDAAPTFAGPPASVKLGIADADGSPVPELGEGVYLRTLDPAAGSGSATLTARLPTARPARVTVGVDSRDRAFIYVPSANGAADAGQLVRNDLPAVRLRPLAPLTLTTQPVAAFPVVIEVDNAADDARLELRVRPARTGPPSKGDAASALDEVVRLGGPRRDRLYVDPTGPTEGVLLTSTSADWVHPLDLRSLRGAVEVVAVLTPAVGTERPSASIRLTIDATAPDAVEIIRLPDALEKGKPLPVEVRATDLEGTPVTKVTVFLAKPGDDGKLPPDAVKADAVRDPKRPTVWLASLPVLADKKPTTVTAQATNAAGLTATAVKEIKLVDAPPPLGRIAGKLVYGDRPQPGLVVTLFDPDSKAKATATTDAKGAFAFDKLPPGKYSLTSARPDSGVGSKAAASAQVEANKTAAITLTLTRMPIK